MQLHDLIMCGRGQAAWVAMRLRPHQPERLIVHIGGYLKSSLREAPVGRVFCVVDMSQCSIRVFDRDSQYPTGISDAPFLLLVLGMKHLSCVGAWIAADQGCG